MYIIIKEILYLVIQNVQYKCACIDTLNNMIFLVCKPALDHHLTIGHEKDKCVYFSRCYYINKTNLFLHNNYEARCKSFKSTRSCVQKFGCNLQSAAINRFGLVR